METLNVLEEKVKLLVGYVQKLQSEKNALALERESLEKRNRDLLAENERLIEEHMQLKERAKEAQASSTKGTKQLESLNKEKELTKVTVDELIKSIDGFVKSEVQR
jgi:FtsZ-binding cell division protein ZapB